MIWFKNTILRKYNSGDYQNAVMKSQKNMQKVVIIGRNPIVRDIERQLKQRDTLYTYYEDYPELSESACHFEEMFVLTSADDCKAMHEDQRAMDWLRSLAKLVRERPNRPVVHLLVQSHVTLWTLQTMDMPADLNECFELYPFTLEDIWAKNALVQLPGIKNMGFPPLDRESISADSKSCVHVVISGFGRQAEALATHVALVAHYPNYHPDDAVPLRSRITIIDTSIQDKRDSFIARHQHLFEHSFYRTIDVKKKQVDFHYPYYYGQRKDFVDVEWEFVEGSIHNPDITQKINEWVVSEKRQLTFFIAHDDDCQNMSVGMSLPSLVYEHKIPVFVQQYNNGFYASLCNNALYSNLYLFGMKDRGYDIQQPLWVMAQLLKYFYDCSYGNLGVPTELPMNKVREAWRNEISFKMRLSNMYNVMTISTKMRSLGHDAKDSDTFYALTQKEIEQMAETEHNRWTVERLLLGNRPCTDDELRIIREDVKVRKKEYKKRNIHFDLRAYQELEEDGTGKNAKVYDYDLTACIPLIVNTFYEYTESEK